MRKDKEKAFQLRNQGKSYNEIKSLLGVPKSTLSDWLSESDWSKNIKNQLTKKSTLNNTIRLRELNKIYRTHLAQIYEEGRIEAKKEFEYFKFHPLFIAGISIYWGEGDKVSKHNIRIANTDPAMIKLFVKFLSEICGIPREKIRANILLYPDLNAEKCKSFWRKQSGLSKKNFTKCITIVGRHKTRRLKYGVCNVNVCSTYLKEKLRVWLTLLPKEFIKDTYYRKAYYSAGVV